LIVKIIIIFLAVMAVLAMLGRLRFPGRSELPWRKCHRCGRHLFGSGSCNCGKS